MGGGLCCGTDVVASGQWALHKAKIRLSFRFSGATVICLAVKFENRVLKNLYLKCQCLSASGCGVGEVGGFSLAAFHLV